MYGFSHTRYGYAVYWSTSHAIFFTSSCVVRRTCARRRRCDVMAAKSKLADATKFPMMQ